MSDVRSHYAEIGPVTLHYLTAGHGTPVVLLHGIPQTCHEWRHVIPLLASRVWGNAAWWRAGSRGHNRRPLSANGVFYKGPSGSPVQRGVEGAGRTGNGHPEPLCVRKAQAPALRAW